MINIKNALEVEFRILNVYLKCGFKFENIKGKILGRNY